MTVSVGTMVHRLATGQAVTLDEATENRLISCVRAEVKRRQAALDLAHKSGDRDAQASAENKLCRSLRVRFAACYEAKLRYDGAEAARENLGALARRALDLTCSHRLDARPFRQRKRDSDGWRWLLNFDEPSRARQTLARFALEPLVPSQPFQFTRRPLRARREAIQQAASLVSSEGVFIQMDVRDFFGSISLPWLDQELPLFHGWARSVVTAESLRLRESRFLRPRSRLEEAFSLPTGAACSPIAADLVMGRVVSDCVRTIGENRLVVYGDNIGAFVEPHEVQQALSVTREAFDRFSGGSFHLKQDKPIPLRSGFRFLGNWFALRDGELQQFLPVSHWSNIALTCREDAEIAMRADDREKAMLACSRAMGRLAHHRPCRLAVDEQEWWKALLGVLDRGGIEAGFIHLSARSLETFSVPPPPKGAQPTI